jgi:hypothetical protein
MYAAMLRLGRILALLAAIMLVIGGAPGVASANACSPCPPDCPMMKRLAADQAASHGPAAKGGKADNPCQQMVACQTVTASVAASEQVSFAALSAAPVTHEAYDPPPAPSRPPDRSLRPPIRI